SMGLENIPIVGLAERNEELFKPYVSESLVLPRASDELRLVTYIRDEAHRFAITYHRSLREKRVLESELDRISGIGDKRKKILIEHFGDIEGIKNADIDSLCAVKGIDIRTARNIYQHFRK
ncbi:MAG: excinuclease ABC subunit C, partial [Christensenellaceae bacterium]|nr:excinuclease ABC subunit C [Christensenellaceae bacterium]